MVLRLPSWRVVAFTLIAMVVMVAVTYTGNAHFLATDPGTAQQRERVISRHAPLIEALKRYHNDNGFYPTRLDRLIPHYVQAVPGHKAYLFHGSDPVVVDSAECVRERSALSGMVMTKTRELAARRERWEADCVTGWRQFTLQSPDFHAPTKGNVERWVQYQSQAGDWVMGWCEHQISQSSRSRLGHNGVCRW